MIETYLNELERELDVPRRCAGASSTRLAIISAS